MKSDIKEMNSVFNDMYAGSSERDSDLSEMN